MHVRTHTHKCFLKSNQWLYLISALSSQSCFNNKTSLLLSFLFRINSQLAMPWLFWVLRENYLNVKINHKKKLLRSYITSVSEHESHTHRQNSILNYVTPKWNILLRTMQEDQESKLFQASLRYLRLSFKGGG